MYDNLIVFANLFILISSILLVLVYGDSRKLKISYSLLSFGTLTWLLTLLLYYSAQFEPLLLTIGKSNFVAINIATVSYYFFIKVFTDKSFKIGKKEFIYILISLYIAYLTLFTNHIILKEVALADEERETIFGDWFYIYALKLLSDVILSFVVAIRSYKNSDKEFKSQIRIFLFGTFFALLLGGFTNLILPQLGIFTFQRYGIFGLSILNLSVVYLIVRYQFLNVKILLGRTFYYLVLMTIAILVFWGIEVAITSDIFDNNRLYRVIFFSAASFLFVHLFNWVIDFLKKQVRVQFINPGYDPYEIIEDFNKKVSRLLTVEDISKEFSSIINRTLRPSKSKLLLTKDIKNENPFKKVWEHIDTEILDNQTLDSYIKSETDIKKKKLLEIVKRNMQDQNIKILISLKDKGEQIALLFIGKREIDSIYSQYDKEFLLNLSQVISISLARAFLHQEVEDFNKVLQNKVDIQTKELKLKVKELEEARRKENDMIDIMGHELRTPATVIKLNIDFLHQFTEKLPTDKESFLKYITRIKDAVETEIKLINTLLTSAKLAGDKVEINPEKVDVFKEIDMALHAEEALAKEKGLKLVNNIKENSSFIFADHARVSEIFNNLISNAVRYTQKGSVTVDTKEEGKYIKIMIKDTGRGIDKSDIAKLGKKFYRTKTYIPSNNGDSFNIVRPGGTGLGLYVTFGLTKKMGGRVEVQSEVGKGSTFSISLPKYTNQNQSKDTDSKDMFTRLNLKKGK